MENSVEDMKIIEYNMKCIRNVMNNFEDELCENMQTKIDEVSKIIDNILSDYKRVLEENEELKADNYELNNRINDLLDSIPVQKVKDIIERIDYDIKKTKEIISNNSNIYTSNRKNDYQIVRLRAMNTKSLDIKNRLQELLEGR